MPSRSGQKFSAEPLGVAWSHGTAPGAPGVDPPVQVHWHDEHTVVLRAPPGLAGSRSAGWWTS